MSDALPSQARKGRASHPSRARGPTLRQFGDSAIFIVLAGLVLLFSFLQPAFLHVVNVFQILQSVTVTALLGLGITVSLAVGGFDLSVGSTAALAVMIASYAQVVWSWGALATVILVLATGAAVGAFNALLTVTGRIPDLLATLGTLFLVGGLQLIPSAGRSIAPGMPFDDGSTAQGYFSTAFLALGRGRLWHVVPMPVVILLIVAPALWLLLERTSWGRVVYAVGGNERAAHLAGAPTRRTRSLAYVLSGMLASLGGILLAARVGRGDITSGGSLLQDGFAAALIGYAVLNLRRPNVLGTLVGAVLVGVLLNGLTMLNAPYYAQDFIKGVVLVASLALTYRIGRDAAA